MVTLALRKIETFPRIQDASGWKSEIIVGDLVDLFPAEYRGERFIAVGHFGMGRGRPLIGRRAAHLSLALLAAGEIAAQCFLGHCCR